MAFRFHGGLSLSLSHCQPLQTPDLSTSTYLGLTAASQKFVWRTEYPLCRRGATSKEYMPARGAGWSWGCVVVVVTGVEGRQGAGGC